MNHEAKLILSKEIEKTIKSILVPMEVMQSHVAIEPFHDEKYLHESKIIYATFTFLSDNGTTPMIQKHQIEAMENIGYMFVSVDSDGVIGMKMTFHKHDKFTTI